MRVLEGENTRRRRARVHEFTRARGPQCRRWGRDKHAIHASRDNAYRPGSAPLHQEPRRSPRTKWRTHARLVSCTRSTTKTGREREREKNKTERSEEPGGLGYNVLAPAKLSSCAITTAMRRYRFILPSMRVSRLHPVYDLRKTKTEEKARRDKIETKGNRRIRADVKGSGKRN